MIVLPVGLLMTGMVGLLADPLHLSASLLSALDQRASVISMFIGAAGLAVSVIALLHRGEGEGRALPRSRDHRRGIHGEVEAGAWPTAAHTLPADVALFTGRRTEMDEVLGANASVFGIDGMAGVGKTAFAQHAAHQLAPRFPDGQLFVRLHGHTPGQLPVDPADALSTLPPVRRIFI
ncbi:hypothetical protein ACIBEJ_21525 [Nonomuraea sp. NPDC050790]|uniref:hypothetical protein n=1 Tax=Nonomuraea sp. NPDC050790 TaxID=3364371 RepID=UPI00379B7D08